MYLLKMENLPYPFDEDTSVHTETDLVTLVTQSRGQGRFCYLGKQTEALSMLCKDKLGRRHTKYSKGEISKQIL